MVKCKNCGKEISDYAVVCPNCGVSPTHFSDVSTNRKTPCSPLKKYKTIFSILAVILAISAFLLVCAQSAYNTVSGRSPIGIGAILFEEYIIYGPIRPIIIARTMSALVVIFCLAGIAICMVKLAKLKSKS